MVVLFVQHLVVFGNVVQCKKTKGVTIFDVYVTAYVMV